MTATALLSNTKVGDHWVMSDGSVWRVLSTAPELRLGPVSGVYDDGSCVKHGLQFSETGECLWLNHQPQVRRADSTYVELQTQIAELQALVAELQAAPLPRTLITDGSIERGMVYRDVAENALYLATDEHQLVIVHVPENDKTTKVGWILDDPAEYTLELVGSFDSCFSLGGSDVE